MSNLNALVIEDDKNLALAFAEALEEAGYEAEVIYDGRTALKRLEEVTPSIVILDLHIPHVKGDKVLEYMRSENHLKDVRVIVATADSSRAAQLGNKADLVLLKPVGYRQLKDLAARLKPK